MNLNESKVNGIRKKKLAKLNDPAFKILKEDMQFGLNNSPFVINACFTVLLGLTLAGCSSVTLTAAASLSKIGQNAANQMETIITPSQDSFIELKKSQAFTDGYNNVIGNQQSKDNLKAYSDIQVQLARYGKWLESLKLAYSALGELVAYDATENFNSSIDILTADTTNLVKTFNSSIPSEVTSTIRPVGGFMIGSIQACKAKVASKNIEALLNLTINVLKNEDTKKTIIMSLDSLEKQKSEASEILSGINGVTTSKYTNSQLADDFLSPKGLKSTPDIDTIVSKDTNISTRLKIGLDNVRKELAPPDVKSAKNLLEKSYDTGIDVLGKLIPLHDSIQKGENLDLNMIISITNQLQSTSTSPQPIKGK